MGFDSLDEAPRAITGKKGLIVKTRSSSDTRGDPSPNDVVEIIEVPCPVKRTECVDVPEVTPEVAK